MSRSIEWLMASVYPLMAPGMLLAFFLGLGSVEPMAQCFIQTWPRHVLTFLVWWGIVTLAGALADGAKREPEGPHPKTQLEPALVPQSQVP